MIYVAYSNISAKQVPVARKMYRWEKNPNFNGFQSRYHVCLLSICQSYSFDITAHMAKCAHHTFDAFGAVDVNILMSIVLWNAMLCKFFDKI